MKRHCVALAGLLVAALSAGIGWRDARAQTALTVATVKNGDMVVMQRLASHFEAQHPDIQLRWVVLEENVLRQRLTADIATRAGQYDVLTIGNYEVPGWARQGWLEPLDDLPAAYDADDLLAPVRSGLTHDGRLYALPFYAESAMTYYRTDLFQKAGLMMPDRPTYAQIRSFAERLTDRANQISGICLRGKPGWGENMAFITSLVTAFGGQWFDTGWQSRLDTPEWRRAIGLYTELLREFGPPAPYANGFNENLALFAAGRCAMWIDASVAAGMLFDARQSQVADRVGFAPMPTGDFVGGPTWLWSWNLAVPRSSRQKAAARLFVTWATSRAYAELVGREQGWMAVPPGTRRSTYENPAYQHAAPFGSFVLRSIEEANPAAGTREPRPYGGAQFVAIPEFPAIGTQVGQIVSTTLAGQSVEHALKAAQAATERAMRQAGYRR